jgi:hypothetical protein
MPYVPDGIKGHTAAAAPDTATNVYMWACIVLFIFILL